MADYLDTAPRLPWSGDDDVDRLRADEPLAELQLRVARICRRVGHHETGATAFVERREECLNPDVVGVVGFWQPEREAPAGSSVADIV